MIQWTSLPSILSSLLAFLQIRAKDKTICCGECARTEAQDSSWSGLKVSTASRKDSPTKREPKVSANSTCRKDGVQSRMRRVITLIAGLAYLGVSQRGWLFSALAQEIADADSDSGSISDAIKRGTVLETSQDVSRVNSPERNWAYLRVWISSSSSRVLYEQA